jgi:hypothetical protein
MKDSIKQLSNIIEKQHNCTAHFIKDVSVLESFKGNTVWKGAVSIFELKGHPKANTCYAWSSAIDGSTKRRYYAVLHIPPIDSPEKAVRASIVQDFKTGYSPT